MDAIGYLIGYAYDLEITRVINRGLSIDYVFGIDMPCISSRKRSIDLEASLIELRSKLNVVRPPSCLLYTSDAAEDLPCVDLGGIRFIIKNTIETSEELKAFDVDGYYFSNYYSIGNNWLFVR